MNTDAKLLYIYVLDYCDATLCEIKVTEEELETKGIEDIIEEHGININTASWMLVDKQIQTIDELN